MALKSSIVSYPERGTYGNNKYRGICSGKLIKDIITTSFYHINSLSDYMVGSGTTEEVCREMKVSGTYLDLNRGFDMMTMDIPDIPENIFWHPPYGSMIVYSDNMYKAEEIINKYGFDPRVNDLSRCPNWDIFVDKMNFCLLKQFTALKKGGRMFILMGDWKQKGHLYSMLCDIAKLGTLEQIIVKAEHNCWSDNNSYSNYNFIPIQHEYLMVLRKDSALIIPVAFTKKSSFDIRDSKVTTWRDVIFSILSEYGEMSLKQLYEAVKSYYPVKCSSNNHVEEKVRQIVRGKYFKSLGNTMYCVA